MRGHGCWLAGGAVAASGSCARRLTKRLITPVDSVQLHLNDNNLYGTLPGKFFSEMPHLRSLFLQTNRIFYTLPPEVGRLSNAAIMCVACASICVTELRSQSLLTVYACALAARSQLDARKPVKWQHSRRVWAVAC